MQCVNFRGMALGAAAVASLVLMPMSASAQRVAVTLKQADVTNGERIYSQGKGEVPACNSCHGATGMGNDAMGTPRLAGQGFSYLVKQLEDFATDKRTDATMFVMNANAKGLTQQDRRDVAAYLFYLDTDPEPSDLTEVQSLGHPVGQRHLGKGLVYFGAPQRGITSCYACHQYNGRGAFPVYPQLAGQKYVYLVNQLKQWRDGSRSNDPMSQMQKVARNLSDEDIHNVAAYLTSAPLTTKGNNFVPAHHIP